MKDRLKQIINSLNINQKTLAEAIGLKPSTISDFLNGRFKTISSETIRQLYELYRVNPIWLLTGEGEMFLVAEEKPPVGVNRNGTEYEVIEGNVETYPKITLVEQISRTGWFRNLSPHKREIVAAVDEIQDADYIRLTSENMLNKVQADRARAAEKARLRQKGETG